MNRIFIYLLLVLGALGLGLILPLNAGDTYLIIQFLNDLVVNVALWTVLPLIFLQVMINTSELRRNMPKGFVLKTIIILFASALFASTVGAILVLLINPSRLAPVYSELQGMGIPDISSLVSTIIPSSIFKPLSGSVTMLPAITIIGLVLGYVLFEVQTQAKLIVDFGKGLLAVFSKLNAFIAGIGFFLVPIPVVFLVLTLRGIPDYSNYISVIIILCITVLSLILLVFPLILLLTKRIKNFGVYYAFILIPMIFGAATASSVTAYSMFFRSAEDNNITFPGQQWLMSLLCSFSRVGTALVSSICVFILIRSFTSIELAFTDIVLIILVVSFSSFLLTAIPGAGVLGVFSVLIWVFGKGYVDNYRILQPLLPLLTLCSVMLDLAVQGFIVQFARYSHAGSNAGNSSNSNALIDFQM